MAAQHLLEPRLVLAADAARQLDVARGDGVDDRLMGLGDRLEVELEGDHRQRRVVGDAEAAPHRLEQLVGAGLDDQAMEALAVLDGGMDVVGDGGGGHGVDLGLQRADVVLSRGVAMRAANSSSAPRSS